MNTPASDLSSEQNPPSNHKVHLVWGSVFIAVCTLGVISYKFSMDKALEAHDKLASDGKKIHDVAKADIADLTAKVEHYAKKMAEEAETLAAKFKTGTITETFKSESPIFEFIKVGRLEVAVCEEIESFSRKDENTKWWGLWNPGPTASEIKVPATYRYHLDMAEDWKVEVKDKCCVVHAPSLKASLPVAINTSKMEKRTDTGWFRPDGTEQMDKLEKEITPRLNDRASAPGHMNAARTEARDVVARFVRTWLLGSKQWQNDRFTSITVIFADESPNMEAIKPTLTIDMLP